MSDHCGRIVSDRCKLTLTKAISAVVVGSCMTTVSALAQDQTPAEARAEATETFGTPLPELEVYPDSGVVGAWMWMKDVEDGEGILDPKTRELIGLAVASQIPCQYCIAYHRKAATSLGASEQEMREASAVAANTRHWSTMLYGAQVDLEEYKATLDKLFASQ